MDKTKGMLTVFFDEPFQVGVFELTENGRLSTAEVKESGLALVRKAE